MKINRMSWENYKGLPDDELVADGADMMISGRNGTGKTSIASVVNFVLFGDDSAKVKQFDNGIAPTDDGLVHSAEVTFDDGTTFRREYFWKGSGNTHKLYINGDIISKTKYAAIVDSWTRGAGKLLFSPFAFCEMKKDDQRALLVKIFGEASDAELFAREEFANVKNILGTKSIDAFLADGQRTLKKFKADSGVFKPQISELQKLLELEPNANDLSTLENDLKVARAERSKISVGTSAAVGELDEKINSLRQERDELLRNTPPNYKEQGANLQRRAVDLTDRQNYLSRQIENARAEKQDLLDEYRKVEASTPGKCPTCGQTIPIEQHEAKRDKNLSAIVDKGKRIAADIFELEKKLANVDAELKDIAAQIQDVKQKEQAQATENATRSEQLMQLDKMVRELTTKRSDLQREDEIKRRELFAEADKKIDGLTIQVTQIKAAIDAATRTRRRIDALREEEKTLNAKIAELENNVALVKLFLQEKIYLFEAKINSHFEHVRFKLFDLLITTGEAKPTCEPTLHGVPYSALSKGERLKAALDIYKTLQNHFQIEMPLLLDDAESYTMNSLIELPNQKFFFRVDECDLTIKTETRRAA